MKRVFAVLATVLFAFGISGEGFAQDNYTNRPIKIVIPLGPGSGNDVVTRLLSESLENDLKTRIEVVYRAGGAGGVVGADFVAKSKPDGYTLGTLNNSVFTISPVFNPSPYDPLRDFSPIARLGSGSVVLVVNSNSPWNTLDQFLDYARKNPGKATSGTTGATAVGGLDIELLKIAAGVPLTLVPYKEGSGPNIAALLGGHIDSAMQLWPILTSHVRGGKLRPLATTSPLKEYPQVPTFAQRGLTAVSLDVWFGFYGPANLPKEVMAKLVPAFENALKDPAIEAKLQKIGWRVDYEGPREVSERIQKEHALVQEVAEKAGLKKK